MRSSLQSSDSAPGNDAERDTFLPTTPRATKIS